MVHLHILRFALSCAGAQSTTLRAAFSRAGAQSMTLRPAIRGASDSL